CFISFTVPTITSFPSMLALTPRPDRFSKRSILVGTCSCLLFTSSSTALLNGWFDSASAPPTSLRASASSQSSTVAISEILGFPSVVQGKSHSTWLRNSRVLSHCLVAFQYTCMSDLSHSHHTVVQMAGS